MKFLVCFTIFAYNCWSIKSNESSHEQPFGILVDVVNLQSALVIPFICCILFKEIVEIVFFRRGVGEANQRYAMVTLFRLISTAFAQLRFVTLMVNILRF